MVGWGDPNLVLAFERQTLELYGWNTAKPDITQAYKVLSTTGFGVDAPETSTITIIDPQAEGRPREGRWRIGLAAVGACRQRHDHCRGELHSK